MTIRTEVIALLDGVAALGRRNYGDNAPPEAEFPYTIFKDEISRNPAIEGDGRTLWWSWLGQVDVWFSLSGEDGTLVDSVVNALDGVKVASGLRLKVTTQRLTDPLFDAGHVALTLRTPRPR